MPLFRSTQIQKFSPKAIKLADFYKHLLKTNNLNDSDKIKIRQALLSSGYDNSAASKIISGQDLSVLQIKKIAQQMSQAGLRGLAQADAHKLVDKYVYQEAVKRKNVAGRRRELMMESLQEDIYEDKTPRLKNNNKNSQLKTGRISGSKIKLGF